MASKRTVVTQRSEGHGPRAQNTHTEEQLVEITIISRKGSGNPPQCQGIWQLHFAPDRERG